MKCFPIDAPAEQMFTNWATWTMLGYLYSMTPLPSTSVTTDQTCDWAMAAPGGDWKIQCGGNINIFTDFEPDDMFAITSLFSSANALNCESNQYPIKFIFGGGGFNDMLTHEMLKAYLRDLRAEGIVPADEYFNIEENTFPGPTSSEMSQSKFDRWGVPFNKELYRGNRNLATLGGYVDQRTSTINHVMNIQKLIGQNEPIIIAMRPIYEYVVCWFEAWHVLNTNMFIPRQRDYEDAMVALLHSLEEHAAASWKWDSLLEAFKGTRIVLYAGDSKFEQLRLFYTARIQYRDATRNLEDDVQTLEQSFMQLPRQLLMIDRDQMLTNDHGIGDNFLFTAFTQYEVWDKIRRRPRIVDLFTNILINWNTPRIEALAKAVRKSLRWRSPLLQKFALQVQAAARLGLLYANPGVGDRSVGIQYRMAKLNVKSLADDIEQSTLAPGGKRDAVDAVYAWRRRAFANASFVDVNDVLLPLVLEPGDSVVRRSLVRVDYPTERDPLNRLVWPTAASTSGSTAFMTKVAPDWITAQSRTGALRAEIRALYVRMFGDAAD